MNVQKFICLLPCKITLKSSQRRGHAPTCPVLLTGIVLLLSKNPYKNASPYRTKKRRELKMLEMGNVGISECTHLSLID